MVEVSEADNPHWDEESFEEVEREHGTEPDPNKDTAQATESIATSESRGITEKIEAVNIADDDSSSGEQGSHKPKGTDSIYRAKVSLEDLYNGRTLKLPIERTVCVLDEVKMKCAPCQGTGYVMETRQAPSGDMVPYQQKCVVCNGEGVQSKGKQWQPKTISDEVSVEVRPGMRNGQRITVPGKGDESRDTSAGDLHVILEEEPHPIFKRKNEHDLLAAKEVSLEDAMGGVEWKFTLLDQSETTVKAEAKDIIYSQAGGHIIKRVPNGGMPALDMPTSRGALEVVFHVQEAKSEQAPRKPNAFFGAIKSLGEGITNTAMDRGLGVASIGVSAASALSSLFGDDSIAQCKSYEPTSNSKVVVTPSFGGSGGGMCDHGSEQPKLEKLVIYDDGHVVRAIDVYYFGKPKSSIGQHIDGATASTLELGADEYICFIKVRSNRYVQELTFGTNRGNTLGPCGGKGWLPIVGRDTIGYETLVLGDPSFRLCGLRGTVGRRLDSIAFYLEKLDEKHQ